MVTFKQQMALDTATFMNQDEFAELMTYTSPAGVVTLNVQVVAAKQTFIQEYEDYAGLGASLAIAKSSLPNVEIHGTLTDVTGLVYDIQQLFSIDEDFLNVAAVADKRLSPQGMR